MNKNMGIANLAHPARILCAALGFALFSIGGYFAPKVYLQYFDKREYVSVPNLTTFDRKVYSAGETQTARLTLKIDINSDIVLKSRLMLILMDNQFRPINSTEAKGFVTMQKDAQTYIIDAPLPCNLAEGKYLYRAELQYEIQGVQKYTPFDTDVFTIDNERASDSAQISKNCPGKITL